MKRGFNFRGAGLFVWAVVAVFAAGLFLYANHSTVASYKAGELPSNAVPGGAEPLLW